MKRRANRTTDEEPTIVKQDGRETVFTHPAYGALAITRQHSSGGEVLFGSNLLCETTISIKLTGAVLRRSHYEDRHSPGEPIVEVHMSEAQWATFVSSISIGEGVPCTISRHGYTPVPTIPFRDPLEESKKDTDAATRAVVAELQAAREKVAAGLKGVSKAAQADILSHFDTAIRKAGDSLPFVAEQFVSQMEAAQEQAKIAANGYVQGVLREMGMNGLQQLASGEGAKIALIDAREDRE